MPALDEDIPEKLQPFIFQGVDLDYGNGKEALGECPWCGKAKKFSVVVATGQWRCLSCNDGTEQPDTTIHGGNVYTFIRMMHERALKITTTQDYEELAHDRRLNKFESLIVWEIGKNHLTGEWLVPGYSVDGKLANIYKYAYYRDKRKLLATPTLGHRLHGVNLFDKNKNIVFIDEGPWDGVALWESLGMAREVDGKLTETANTSASLLEDANVLAVPGCGVFFEAWLPLLAGKVVNLMYDNDHSRTHPQTGKPLEPPALMGMRRAARMMLACKTPPDQINFCKWGEEGYDVTLPDGYDVRDDLNKEE